MTNWDYEADKFWDRNGPTLLKYGAIGGAVIGFFMGFAGAGLGGAIAGTIIGGILGFIAGLIVCSLGGLLVASVPHLIGCAVIGGILLLIAALWGVGKP